VAALCIGGSPASRTVRATEQHRRRHAVRRHARHHRGFHEARPDGVDGGADRGLGSGRDGVHIHVERARCQARCGVTRRLLRAAGCDGGDHELGAARRLGGGSCERHSEGARLLRGLRRRVALPHVEGSDDGRAARGKVTREDAADLAKADEGDAHHARSPSGEPIRRAGPDLAEGEFARRQALCGAPA
jgi:hypothetical protein